MNPLSEPSDDDGLTDEDRKLLAEHDAALERLWRWGEGKRRQLKPEIVEVLKRSEADVAAGRTISHEEILEKYPLETT